MTSWYRVYLQLLHRIARSRFPSVWLLWMGLVSSCGWTGFWILGQQRQGGELLLPILLTLWLLSWLFIRQSFQFNPPTMTHPRWRATLARWWFGLKFHGMASLILILLCSCLFISLKLVSVLWRSFA